MFAAAWPARAALPEVAAGGPGRAAAAPQPPARGRPAAGRPGACGSPRATRPARRRCSARWRVRAPSAVARTTTVRWLWLGLHRRAARAVGRRRLGRAVRRGTSSCARDAGALAVLPLALICARRPARCSPGELSRRPSRWSRRCAAIDRGDRQRPARRTARSALAALARPRGRGDRADRGASRGEARSARRGHRARASPHYATAVLVQRARPVRRTRWSRPRGRARTRTSSASPTGRLAELIEAAVRTRRRSAADAVRRRRGADRRPRPSGTDWALGIEARSRALVSRGPDGRAPATGRRSSGSAARRVRVELARAHLLYGEWLRRREPPRRRPRAAARRARDVRRDGRRRLRRARPPRAAGHRRDGPQAHGRRPATSSPRRRRRSPGWPGDGRTNPEIGAQLFISPRTVEWHLRKVFAKLGISSRRELVAALPDGSSRLRSSPEQDTRAPARTRARASVSTGATGPTRTRP